MTRSMDWRAKLTDRSARTGVVGLGHVGLPLAVEFARAGFATTGIDVDSGKVDAVNQGTSYCLVAASAQLIADTRNAIAGRHAHVFKLGAPSPMLAPSPQPADTGAQARA